MHSLSWRMKKKPWFFYWFESESFPLDGQTRRRQKACANGYPLMRQRHWPKWPDAAKEAGVLCYKDRKRNECRKRKSRKRKAAKEPPVRSDRNRNKTGISNERYQDQCTKHVANILCWMRKRAHEKQKIRKNPAIL